MTAGQVAVHLLLGLGPGAVYAALGLGLVVMHRGSGVLNLAFGAMAMYPGYVYASLRRSGDLVLPGIPGTHHLAGQVPVAPALSIALVVGAVLGLLGYILVFRPLRSAPPLASVVACVGVLLTLQSVVVLRFGGDPRLVDPLLPQQQLRVAGMVVPADRLYLVGLVVVLAAGANMLFTKTRFGLACRAATEGHRGHVATELLGISTVWLGALTWAIGGVIAGLFGILLAPIAGLSPSGYGLLVVPALVAAIAGRLVSVAWTVAGGLVLGIVQSEATLLRLPWAWLPPDTVREVVPFVALVVVLLALGTPLPTRGTEVGSRLPPAPPAERPVVFAALLVVAGVVGTVATTGSLRNAVVVSLISVVLCLSVVVLTGFAGQVSLAQMSFAAIGAFVLSRVATEWHVPFPLGALGAAGVAAAAGALLGLATSRSRGVTVAMVSLGAALTVEELLIRHLSSGVLASNRIAAPRPLGLDLGPLASDGTPRVAFGVFVVVVVALVALGVLQLRRTGLGRRMLAVRANERAAAATGIDVTRTKLTAFALSAFIAGVGGALLGYHQTALSGQSFAISRSLLLLAVTYIGGVASTRGAVVGGLVIPGGIIAVVADRLLHLAAYATLFSAIIVTVLAVRRSAAPLESGP